MLKLGLLSLAMVCLAGCTSAPTNAVDAAGGCNSPLGYIPDNGTAVGYLHQIEQGGQSCQQGILECHDGNWTGTYIYPSCTRLP